VSVEHPADAIRSISKRQHSLARSPRLRAHAITRMAPTHVLTIGALRARRRIVAERGKCTRADARASLALRMARDSQLANLETATADRAYAIALFCTPSRPPCIRRDEVWWRV
jgi:hypothetical protein